MGNRYRHLRKKISEYLTSAPDSGWNRPLILDEKHEESIRSPGRRPDRLVFINSLTRSLPVPGIPSPASINSPQWPAHLFRLQRRQYGVVHLSGCSTVVMRLRLCSYHETLRTVQLNFEHPYPCRAGHQPWKKQKLNRNQVNVAMFVSGRRILW